MSTLSVFLLLSFHGLTCAALGASVFYRLGVRHGRASRGEETKP